MSAEQYGRRLLEEVQEESLGQLLADIRHRSSFFPSSKPISGLPALDDLVEAFRAQSQPAPAPPPTWASPSIPGAGHLSDDDQDDHEDYAPVHVQGHTSSRQQRAVPKPTTIELTSLKSGSGKTTLLSYISALAALPTTHGGRESAVIYVDNDGRFSATRLVQIITHHLETLPPTPTAETIRDIAHETLNHIYIFRPQSSTQLLSILDSLPSFLLDRTRHSSIYRPLGLVVLDSATAFYWQDRFDRTVAQLDTPTVADRDQPSKTTEIIARLKALQKRFECAVMFSSTSAAPTQKSMQTPHTDPNVAVPPTPSSLSPWTTYATLTLNLTRPAIPQFAPQMSLDECLRDAEKRLDAVRNAPFVATVQEWRHGQGQGQQQVLTLAATGGGEGRSRRHAGFAFKVVEDGVDVE